MPTVRHRTNPPLKPLKARDKNRAIVPPLGTEVIVLSSDDEDVSPRWVTPPKKKKQNRGQSKTRAADGPATLLDLEDEDIGKRSRAALEKEVLELKQENRRLEVSLGTAQAEAKRLQTLSESKSKLVSTLDDLVSCEICTLIMWSPYTLPCCGHTFCASCLQDWFSTILAAHMQQHPEYAVDVPLPPQWRRVAHDARHREAVRRYIADERRRMPQPEYTCPACRVAVTSRPVEVYKLKEVVRAVAPALGSAASPKRVLRMEGGGPWDGFFPD